MTPNREENPNTSKDNSQETTDLEINSPISPIKILKITKNYPGPLNSSFKEIKPNLTENNFQPLNRIDLKWLIE